MARPKVNISTTNGNLGGLTPNVDGVCGLIMAIPAAPASGYGTPVLIKSKKQAAEELADETNALALAAINDGFFAEAAEGSKLYCLFLAPTTTLEAMASAANGGKLLSYAAGSISLLALAKFPAANYTPVVTDGIDQDVVKAVDVAQTLASAWFEQRKPFRCLIQGYAFTTPTAVKSYASDKKDNVAIVLGAVNDNTATALLLALGRASNLPVQRNIGRVKNGSLHLSESASVKIGAKLMSEVDNVDLDSLWEKRFITFERNEAAPGYLFNDDNMLGATTSDFSSLRNGRTIDKAVRIAYEVYYNELKDDVDVDSNGRLSAAVEAALAQGIEDAITYRMAGEISENDNGTAAVEALVNPDPVQYVALYSAAGIDAPNLNILSSNQVYIFVRIRPKGCLKYIDVFLGYTAA
jgi:Protein of unknown function (DUF2586)